MAWFTEQLMSCYDLSSTSFWGCVSWQQQRTTQILVVVLCLVMRKFIRKLKQTWNLLIALTHSVPVRSSVWRGKQNAVSQRDEELARTAGLDAPHPPRKLNQQKKNPPKKTHVFYSCFFFLNKETHSIPHFAPEHRLLFMRLATETKTTWEH